MADRRMEIESEDARTLSRLEAAITAAEEINESNPNRAVDEMSELNDNVKDQDLCETAPQSMETSSNLVDDKPSADKQNPNLEKPPDVVADESVLHKTSVHGDEECDIVSADSKQSRDSESPPDSKEAEETVNQDSKMTSSDEPIVATEETSSNPETTCPKEDEEVDKANEETDEVDESQVEEAKMDESNLPGSLAPAKEVSEDELPQPTQVSPQKDVIQPAEMDEEASKKASASLKPVTGSSPALPRVRRSSRAISSTRTGAEESKDTPTATASPAGRATRSQNSSELSTKPKVVGQKVHSSSGKTSSDEKSMEESEKSEQSSLKRKAENVDEEEDNATAQPADKRSRKPVAALNTNNLEALNLPALPESHFLSPPTPVTEGEQEKDESKKLVTVHDTYCWACHTDGQVLACALCPRSYHQRCVQQAALSLHGWVCPECSSVRNAEKLARTIKGPKLEDLNRMLLYALQRVRSVTDCEPFMHEVDPEEVLNYGQYIVNPMDLSHLESKIVSQSYASTRGFLADFRWILHNCIIFNSYQSKLTSVAKSLMKVCRHEMSEIDTCQDCYEHAHTKRDTWFLEPCSRPHLLIWAKLKGYPYWPAKAVKANKEGNVDVRFFGAHDRAWVPVRDCYLYSREVPASNKNKRKSNFESSLAEIELHVKRLTEMFGQFNYAPNKTPYNPSKEEEQLRLMVPHYKPRGVSHPTPQPVPQTQPVSKKSKIAEKIAESQEKSEVKKDEKTIAPEKTEKPTEQGDSKLVSASPASSEESKERPASEVASDIRTEENGEEKATETTPSPSPSQDSNKFFSMLHLAPRSAVENAAASNKRPTFTRMVIRNKNNPTNQPRFVQLSKAEFDQKVRESNPKKPLKVYIAKTIRSGALNCSPPPTTVLKPDVTKTTTSVTTTANTKPVVLPLKSAESPKAARNPIPMPMPMPMIIKAEPMDVDERNENLQDASTNDEEVEVNRTLDEGKDDLKSAPDSPSMMEDDDEVNPAMYLDPTITITLLNHDDKLKSSNSSPEKGVNLEAEVDARNNVEETVSITLVPKKQLQLTDKGSKTGQNLAPKVSLNNNAEDTSSRVIEIDSPAPVAASGGGKSTKTPARARKSMAKSPKAPPALAQVHKSNANQAKVPLPPLCKNVSSNGHSNSGNGKLPSISVKPVAQQQLPQYFNPFGEQGTGTTPQPAIGVVSGTPTSQGTLKTFTSGSGVEYVNAGGGYFLMTRPIGTIQSNGAGVGMSVGLTAATSTTTSTNTATTPRLALPANEAGPISAFLHSKSQQIAEMIRSSLESLLQEAAASGSVEANLVQTRLELERIKWSREKELAEARRSAEALVKEVRTNVEAENTRQLNELRRQFEAEKKQAVEDAKSRQWCAECGKEAVFYCCWNTAYCDYPCQQEHWSKHMATCANASLAQGPISMTGTTRERPSRASSSSGSSSNEGVSLHKPGSKLAHYVQIPAARRAAQRKKVRLYGNKRGTSPDPDDSSDAGLRLDASEDEEEEPHSSKSSPDRSSYNLKAKVPVSARPRRKRCGECAGCLNVVSCGQCFACKSTSSHRICKDRLCLELKKQKLLRAKERARQLQAQANGRAGKGDKTGSGTAPGKKIAPKPSIPPSRPDLGYSVIAPASVTTTTASILNEQRPIPAKVTLPTGVVVSNVNSSAVVTSSQTSVTTTSLSTNALRFNHSALSGPVSFIVSSPKGGGNPKIEGVVLGSNQGGGTQTILSPENYMSLMASQNQGQQQQQQQQTPLPTITLPSLPLANNSTEMPAPMLTSTISFSNSAPVLHYLRPVTQEKRDEK